MIHAPTLSDGLAAYYGGRAKIFGVSGKDRSAVSMAAQDDRSYEVDLKGYGHVFPHPFGQADDKLFCTRILVSPIGDQLTLDFSKALIAHEQMGRDEIPDYLSISFSAVDAVNHFSAPPASRTKTWSCNWTVPWPISWRSLTRMMCWVAKRAILLTHNIYS